MRQIEVFAVRATEKTTRNPYYRIEPFTDYRGFAIFAVFASKLAAALWMKRNGIEGEIVVLSGEME